VGPRAGLEHGGEENNSQSLLGLEPWIIQPIAQRYISSAPKVLTTY